MASCFLQTKPSDAKTKPQEWRESRGPVVPHDSFPRDCTICHAKGSWHEIRSDFVFDHAKETGTPLNGAHGTAQCLRCHNDRGSVATFSKRGCTGCHEDIHRGRLGISCTTCHSENDWNPTGVYAVHAKTRFPLQGVHAGVACVRCHPSSEAGQFLGADPRCEACHRQDAINAKSLDHAAQGLLSNCQQCHSQTSWSDARFNHAGITSGCIKCHQKDQSIANGKVSGHTGFPTNCEACHNTSSWLNAVFNHAGITSGCINCHATEFNSHPNIDHFPGANLNCQYCHVTTSWPAVFKHNSDVDRGDHKNVNCSQCHLSPGSATTQCTPCHNGIPGGKAILPLLKQKTKK